MAGKAARWTDKRGFFCSGSSSLEADKYTGWQRVRQYKRAILRGTASRLTARFAEHETSRARELGRGFIPSAARASALLTMGR